MATYYRPNLTSAERDLLLEILDAELQETYGHSDPEFEGRYSLYLKLRDVRIISTDKKTTAEED